jgi:hypothetical protein
MFHWPVAQPCPRSSWRRSFSPEEGATSAGATDQQWRKLHSIETKLKCNTNATLMQLKLNFVELWRSTIVVFERTGDGSPGELARSPFMMSANIFQHPVCSANSCRCLDMKCTVQPFISVQLSTPSLWHAGNGDLQVWGRGQRRGACFTVSIMEFQSLNSLGMSWGYRFDKPQSQFLVTCRADLLISSETQRLGPATDRIPTVRVRSYVPSTLLSVLLFHVI